MQTSEMFADWLNHVDAIAGYDRRRALGNVEQWRTLWALNLTQQQAIIQLSWSVAHA